MLTDNKSRHQHLKYHERVFTIGLHHPLDGVTKPEYKLLHFIQLIFFQREEGTTLTEIGAAI